MALKKNLIYTRGWQLRIFAAVMLVNLVLIIALSALFQRRSLGFFEQEFAASLYGQALEAGTGLDGAMQSLYQSAADAAFDPRVIACAESGDDMGLAALLREYKNKNQLIDRVSLYRPETIAGANEGATGGTLVRSDEYQQVATLDAARGAELVALMQAQTGTAPLLTSDPLGPSPKNIYVYSQAVTDDSGRLLGYLAVTGTEQQLYNSQLETVAASVDTFGIYTRAGEPLGELGRLAELLPEDSELALALRETPEGEMHLELAGGRYLAVWLELPFSEVRLALLRSETTLQSQMVNMQVMAVLAALILLLISDVILYFIAARFARPVEELATARQEAELKALQYQIRPHFIYNMLNAIRFAATLQRAHSISARLGDFVELLRASTNREGSFTELASEIATLKHYIALQEFRLFDAFDVEFRVAEGALDCIVPRMILQPLVENSILHGPSRERPHCHIEVAAACAGTQLTITVRDDGQGMSAVDIAVVLAAEQRELSHGGLSGIGTASIIERLRLYYGDAARLTYESDGASYTVARLELPVSYDIHEYEL